MRLKYFSLAFLFLAVGCGQKMAPYGQQSSTYANDCSKPREKITLHPHGKGEVNISGNTVPISWKKKNGYIHMSQSLHQNTVIAHYDASGNLILQSLSGRDVKFIGQKDRIRYRCY